MKEKTNLEQAYSELKSTFEQERKTLSEASESSQSDVSVLKRRLEELSSQLQQSRADLEAEKVAGEKKLTQEKEVKMQATRAHEELQMELELERGKTVAVSGVLMESFNVLLSDLPDREQTTKLLELKDKVDRIMSSDNTIKDVEQVGMDFKNLVKKLNEANANIAQFDSQLQQLAETHLKEVESLKKINQQLEMRGKLHDNDLEEMKRKLQEKEDIILEMRQKFVQANLEKDRMSASADRRIKEKEKENRIQNKIDKEQKERAEQELAEAQQQMRIYQTEIAQMRDELSLQRQELEEVTAKKRDVMKKAQGVTDNTFADSYEEVMQEELDMMRGAFEKKISLLKEQLKMQSIKFSRELGETRDKLKSEKTALDVKLKRMTAQMESIAQSGALPQHLRGV